MRPFAAALLALALATPAFAQSQPCGPLPFVNESEAAVQEVYVRQVGTAAWGRDLLGDAVLAPGTRVSITPVAASQHDVLLLRSDGSAVFVMRQTLCGAARVVVSANGRVRVM